MTDDDIRAEALALVTDLNLPFATGMVAYERIVKMAMGIAATLTPAAPDQTNKRGIPKGGKWSDAARARLLNDPVRMAKLRAQIMVALTAKRLKRERLAAQARENAP